MGSIFNAPDMLLLATLDGKVIYYIWGEDFYRMHDFGPEARTKVTQNGYIYVDGLCIEEETIDWEMVEI